MIDIKNIAECADMIVNGYAFTRDGNRVRVLNLNHPAKAAVLTFDGSLLETTMDDIELEIVKGYWKINGKYLEEMDAEVL